MSEQKGFDLAFIIKRQDDSHKVILEKLDKIVEKQSEHGETLVRNTISLEEHIRRTNLLESEVRDVKGDVEDVKDHVDKINFILKIFTPTKSKMKWLVAMAAAAGIGTSTVDMTSKDSTIIKVMKQFIQTESKTESE